MQLKQLRPGELLLSLEGYMGPQWVKLFPTWVAGSWFWLWVNDSLYCNQLVVVVVN